MKPFFTKCVISLCVAAASITLIPCVVTAQFSTLTNETIANTTLSGQQVAYVWSLRTIAVQPNGGYIAVWVDAGGNDGQGEGIYGQLFNASGVKIGAEFLVNTTTAGDQSSPSIAVAPDGSFLIGWEGPGSSVDVFAQKYTSDGVKYGREFLLNTTVSGNQRYPEIQYYPDGTYIAAYVDASAGQTVLQRFDNENRTIGQETRITSGGGAVVLDGLCIRQDNSVVLFWTSAADVYGQIFDSNLNSVGSAKMLNTYTTGTQQYCLGRTDANGNMVFVWESDGQDGSGNGVYCRRFDLNFNALGNEFVITTNTIGDQFGPTMAMEPSGRFIIAWTDNNNRDGGGGSSLISGPGCSIWMREFDYNGNAVGGETMVNQSITGYQGYCLIDINASGRFVIKWEGNGTQPGNIDDYGEFCRAYQLSQTGTTAISVTPSVTIGYDLVTVTMTLTNPTNINNVKPNPLSLSSTNNVFATLVSGPSPASATVGTSPVTFTWTYRVTTKSAPGVLNFGGNAKNNTGLIFPYTVGNTITISPAIYICDLTAPNLVNDANAPNSGPQVFTIGTKVTNAGITTLTNVFVNLGDGVTTGTFPITTMTLAQTNNTYQGSFSLSPLAGPTDCSRSIDSLKPSKTVIAGGIDFNGDAVVNASDDGILSNSKIVIDGRIDVNLSNTVTTADDLPRPPGEFTGYREPTIIDGYVDVNNDGIITASDNGTYGGETKNIYWQVRYATIDAFNQPTFGNGGDLNDDLRYSWVSWATATDGAMPRAKYINEFAKVRQELSTASNKTVPNPVGYISGGPPRILAGMVDINSDGQITTADDGPYFGKTVIDGKVDFNNSGSVTTADDGALIGTFIIIDGFVDFDGNGSISAADDGLLILPGQTFSITFNNATFGAIGQGYDENRDNLYDYDFWHQPVGDPTWPAAAFRLINIESNITGSGGANPLNGITTYYSNEPYLSRLIGDNSGAFDATYTYTFLATQNGNATLTPYQEAASGTNNEKYSGDYPTIGIKLKTTNAFILPVSSIHLTAKLNGSAPVVEWKTETEINTERFIIERSTDNQNFIIAGSVRAAGNSNSSRSYSFSDFADASMQNDIFYYRIKQLDLNNKFIYSNVALVKFAKKAVVKIYPNPFTSNITVIMKSDAATEVNLKLLSLSGKLLIKQSKSIDKGTSQLTLTNLERLSAGVYYLQVEDKKSGFRYVEKYIIK